MRLRVVFFAGQLSSERPKTHVSLQCIQGIKIEPQHQLAYVQELVDDDIDDPNMSTAAKTSNSQQSRHDRTLLAVAWHRFGAEDCVTVGGYPE